jgi:hypothetical protein
MSFSLVAVSSWREGSNLRKRANALTQYQARRRSFNSASNASTPAAQGSGVHHQVSRYSFGESRERLDGSRAVARKLCGGVSSCLSGRVIETPRYLPRACGGNYTAAARSPPPLRRRPQGAGARHRLRQPTKGTGHSNMSSSRWLLRFAGAMLDLTLRVRSHNRFRHRLSDFDFVRRSEDRQQLVGLGLARQQREHKMNS